MSRFEKRGVELSMSIGLDFAGAVGLGVETRDHFVNLHIGVWREHRQWGHRRDMLGVRSFGLGPLGLVVWGWVR